MISKKGLRTQRDSGVLEKLIGAALFIASALWVLWQNSRVAVLWDLSYLLDSAWRFSLGQRPYRDIPFAHAPLTFLIQAGLIRVFGRVYWPHLVYAVLAGGCATLLTWKLLVWVLRELGQRERGWLRCWPCRWCRWGFTGCIRTRSTTATAFSAAC